MYFERGQDEPPNGNLALTGGSWEDELEGDVGKVKTVTRNSMCEGHKQRGCKAA